MFRDKEILHQVLNVKASIHHLDLAIKEIHCKVFQKQHPKYDQEINASCDKDASKIDLMIEKMNKILVDDETTDLSSQMRYLTDALRSIQGEISGAEHLSRQLHQRAQDISHQYKVTEQMINELKGCVSIARACLNTEKDNIKFRDINEKLDAIIKKQDIFEKLIQRKNPESKVRKVIKSN
jgi:hypothetical protein